MRNKGMFIALISILALVLAACGNSDSTEEKSTPATEKDMDKLSYELTEEITSEKGFLYNLQIDDTGEAIMFAEGTQGDEHPSVYVDGEVTELDTEWFNMHSIMSHHGKALGEQYDGDIYTYKFYDVFSGEEETYEFGDDFVTFALRTDFIEDENGNIEEVMRTTTPSNDFWIDIIDMESGAEETIDFEDLLGEYVTSSDFYSPHAFYSLDGDQIYISIQEDSTNDDSVTVYHTYDIATQEVEKIAEIDGYYTIADAHAPFSADGKYLMLAENEGDLFALNLETEELEALDDGVFFKNMDNNKYATINKETGEITVSSIDGSESSVIHTIEGIEDKQLENLAISPTGNTFALIYNEEGIHHLEMYHVK